MKKGVSWVDRNLIQSPYCIGICTSNEKFRKELKRLKIDNSECPDWIFKDDKDATVWTFKESKGREKCFIVCIRKRKSTTFIEACGLLIHESVHIWQTIKENIGEDNPSSEFEAYSIQNIAQSLIEAYKND